MRTSKIVSLSLPPHIYEKTKQVAQEEGRTYSELIRESLRQYLDLREWRALQKYGVGKAKAMGIAEKDVERLIDEYRAENA
ncbi:MAG: ribbon-helix-helix protein, CopG family [Armatimonadetes bacterium]|nr:ribbon-helix-helix protein, CopG family [Armatimonadota bacterium]